MGLLAKLQCPYCGVGCGLEIEKDDKGKIKVKGDKTHPATKGDLCLKPIPLPNVLDTGRITSPLYRENKHDEFQKISWEEALNIIVNKLKENNPDENYFYISGQLTTEDIYVINKFVKGFIKTNNIDANSRLCMASAVMAYKLAFGSDGPPGSYEDIDDADAFIFVGSNAAWTHPVLFKRVLKRKNKDISTIIVTIDPIQTETATKSDIWIPIKPGTDTVLFNSVLYLLNKYKWIDNEFILNHTENYEETLKEAEKYPPEVAAKICDIEEKHIYKLAEIFGHSRKVISFWSMGLNQSVNGTMKNLSLINLHLATGRINEKGCPFSLTGQPNAMGGREVGYLVNGLPGYRDVRNEEDRRFIENYWKIKVGSIKEKPGLTIIEAIDEMLKGNIKFLWIVATNPAVTIPNLNKFWQALEKTFVVVQDAYLNDTMDFANLVLPATQWSEKEGTMTGSDRTITHNQTFKKPPPQSKHDWQIFCEVADKLGWKEYFSYKNSREIFNEYKGTTKGRLCDISDYNYEDLPKQWGKKWLYENKKFPTPSGKAKFIPARYESPADKLEYPFKFILITGRTKKQWHTMTRTGKSLELVRGEEEPFILLNEEDAYKIGTIDGDYVYVQSKRGKIYLKVKTGNIKNGVAFAPFGYGLIFHYPTNLLVSAAIDSISKEPDLKFSAVFIEEKRKKFAQISNESIYIMNLFISNIGEKQLADLLKVFYESLSDKNERFKNLLVKNDINNIIREDIEIYRNIDNLEKVEDKIHKRSFEFYLNNLQASDYRDYTEIFLKTFKDSNVLDYKDYESWKEILNFLMNILKSKADKLSKAD
ncbi:molybdopterin-dependent oxidoreductase [Sulfurihydrogenibium sp.]|uniref:molybdopterin-dependent oxidoreductase n=1 Tax=Sulfurihydrogenibium sp. TaxID=2053621 RepID=UPI0026296055|nr:molybdopterin-dependent oxidoreductase [Sulfurihydrogenibium sp.]